MNEEGYATQSRPSGAREGQGLVEYALILLLVAIFIVAALIFLSTNLKEIFTEIGSSLVNVPR